LEAETTRGEMAQNKYEVTTYKGWNSKKRSAKTKMMEHSMKRNW
jgi:hypothetical protein